MANGMVAMPMSAIIAGIELNTLLGNKSFVGLSFQSGNEPLELPKVDGAIRPASKVMNLD